MNPSLKRVLLIVGFLLTIALIAFALYFVFFKPTPSSPPSPPSDTTQPSEEPTLPTAEPAGVRGEIPPEREGLPEAETVARGGVTKTEEHTQTSAQHLSLNASGTGVQYYRPDDGRFYALDADGNVRSLSERRFAAAQTVVWNNNGEKAILEFPDGSNIVYNFASDKQVSLPSHWTDFQFSPVADTFEAKSIGLDPDNRWMVTSSADGSQVKAFQALGNNAHKVQMSWSPNDQVVAFADTADPIEGGIDRKMIIPIGRNQENFKGLIVEGLGFLPNWSPSGKKLLYSAHGSYSNNKPLLWIVDAEPGTMGQRRASIKLNTWADKCTFASGTEVYCAVPQDLPPNAGFQRKLFSDLPDRLYRINLENGQMTLIAIPEQDTIMENLQVTSSKDRLYFVNRQTDKLESIRLK